MGFIFLTKSIIGCSLCAPDMSERGTSSKRICHAILYHIFRKMSAIIFRIRAPAFTQKKKKNHGHTRTLTDLLFEIHAFVRVCPCGRSYGPTWLNFFGSIESLRVIKAPRRLSHKKSMKKSKCRSPVIMRQGSATYDGQFFSWKLIQYPTSLFSAGDFWPLAAA
jgi:hypothetical protein